MNKIIKYKNLTKFSYLIILILLFLVSTNTSFAETSILGNIFNNETSTLNKNKNIGYIDLSVQNKVKVCKDVSCTDIKPGIIFFKMFDKSSIVIDSEKGITGKVWGDELGVIDFKPPYGGVYFANPETGLLKGTAWSETSGVINFSVTGQKVIIDPNTGEFKGWAWAAGPYGGWIKFDCNDGSCVRTTWRYHKKNLFKNNKAKNINKLNFKDKKELSKKSNRNFSLWLKNILNKTKNGINKENKALKNSFKYSSSFITSNSLKVWTVANNGINKGVKTLKNSFKNSSNFITSNSSKVWNVVSSGINKSTEALKNDFKYSSNFITSNSLKIWNKTKDGLNKESNFVKNSFSYSIDFIHYNSVLFWNKTNKIIDNFYFKIKPMFSSFVK